MDEEKQERLNKAITAMSEFMIDCSMGSTGVPPLKAETLECTKKKFSLKVAAFAVCSVATFICLAGGIICTFLGYGEAIGLFTTVGAITAGGIIAAFGCVAVSDYSKSKYYQEGLVGK